MSELKVNYTYGIITGNTIPENSAWFRGTAGDIGRNFIQSSAFNSLWQGRSVDCIGATTELLIRLMQCSEYWPDYILKYDPVNTYENKLVVPSDLYVQGLTYSDLVSWEKSIDIPASPLYSARSSKIEKFISSLYNLLTVKNG